jgi:integrase
MTRRSVVLIDATSVMSEGPAQAVVEAVKPPRLNRARRCIYCLERDCDSPRCEALYAPRIHAHLTPHSMRHAFGDHVTRHAGIKNARARLGHADVGTTQMYTAHRRSTSW